MADTSDISAWITLFIGLYSLGAAVGELRSPGSWAAMLEGFEENEGLRFLTGIVTLSLGAAIYLVNPWNPEDWLSVIVSLIGGGMALEGFAILAFGRAFLHFANSLIGGNNRGWAILSGILGVALICVALLRF
ncbi:hypothetical protein [Erythrobacter alti]|uniref:hypothetical protein n=1 Tax=Erythrobacter alti TaxID=1896145 RepID=UPI0030F41DCE